jgi:hypothetical protein
LIASTYRRSREKNQKPMELFSEAIQAWAGGGLRRWIEKMD